MAGCAGANYVWLADTGAKVAAFEKALLSVIMWNMR